MIRSNIPKYDLSFDLGKKKLFKVQYTGIWYILDTNTKKSVKIEYTGMWYTIGLWLEKITQGRIYQNIVCSTMVRSNIPECGRFDHGKVEFMSEL